VVAPAGCPPKRLHVGSPEVGATLAAKQHNGYIRVLVEVMGTLRYWLPACPRRLSLAAAPSAALIVRRFRFGLCQPEKVNRNCVRVRVSVVTRAPRAAVYAPKPPTTASVSVRSLPS
jgi:hypothetical protein